jgi:RNA polymerase sigma-70 factor (ECF subfamily)
VSNQNEPRAERRTQTGRLEIGWPRSEFLQREWAADLEFSKNLSALAGRAGGFCRHNYAGRLERARQVGLKYRSRFDVVRHAPVKTRGVSLFGRLGRIQLRMSATLAYANANRAPATSGLMYRFSTHMADENKALAEGLRRRDPELLDRLIEEYQYRLFRYLTYITGDRERAEDFFQETWIRVLERGHQYDGKYKFESWLFTIARHLVIDWQRHKKPQSLDALLDPDEGAPMEFAAGDDASPLNLVLLGERGARVQASLGQLRATYREVLLLRFQEDMQLEEISRVLAIPLASVKSRLYRGLDALKNVLAGGAA